MRSGLPKTPTAAGTGGRVVQGPSSLPRLRPASATSQLSSNTRVRSLLARHLGSEHLSRRASAGTRRPPAGSRRSECPVESSAGAAASLRPKLLAWAGGVLLLLLSVAGWAGVPGWCCRSLAEAGLQSADYQVAERWTEVAGWVEAENPAALLQRARLELALNRTAAAAGWVRRAEQLDPLFKELQAHQLLIEAHRGNRTAVAPLTQSPQPGLPLSFVYRAVVRCAMQHGRFAFARQTAEHWITDLPGDAAAEYHRARIAELEEQTDQAATAYREALRKQPRYSEAAFRLATLLRHQQQFEAAQQLFLQCRQTPLQPIAMIEAADAAWLAAQPARAWQHLESVLEVDPQRLRPLYLRVDEFAENDRVALLAARLKQEQVDAPGVVRYAGRALRYQPRNREAHQMLTAAFQQMQRPAEAAKHVEIQAELLEADRRALALQTEVAADPSNVQVRCELAEALFQGVSLADAQVQLEIILEQQSDSRRAHALLARLYRERAERTKQDDHWRILARRHAAKANRLPASESGDEATLAAVPSHEAGSSHESE